MIAGDLHEQVRQCLDDEVLMATGRSVGDIASGRVADALLAGPLAPLLSKLRAAEECYQDGHSQGYVLDSVLRRALDAS